MKHHLWVLSPADDLHSGQHKQNRYIEDGGATHLSDWEATVRPQEEHGRGAIQRRPPITCWRGPSGHPPPPRHTSRSDASRLPCVGAWAFPVSLRSQDTQLQTGLRRSAPTTIAASMAASPQPRADAE